MPITELSLTPSEPASPPPEGPLRKRRDRYREIDPDELFHVIDDLEGSRNRSRIREFIWISIIAHMMVFWYLAYGPRYFQHVRIVNPSDILRDREKEITALELSDALKQMKSKELKSSPNHAPERQPSIDRKTMEQFRAARKAEAVPPAQQPQPAPPQVAQQQPEAPVTQPLPPVQQSEIEAPKPAARQAPVPTTPSFDTGPATPGDAIRQAARDAARTPSIVGDAGGGSGGSGSGPAAAGGAAIISDTMGVNFDPYLRRIVYDTERAWWPIIPEVARPPLNKQGKVLVRFKILKDGSVKEMQLEGPSGDTSLDRAAWGGITGASPFPPLPKDFKGPYIELRFYFLYNIKQ